MFLLVWVLPTHSFIKLKFSELLKLEDHYMIYHQSTQSEHAYFHINIISVHFVYEILNYIDTPYKLEIVQKMA